jgi:hypothetical protein
MGQKEIIFDAVKFHYVGSAAKVEIVCGFPKAGGIDSPEKWLSAKPPPRLGGTAPGTGGHDTTRLLHATIGVPVQLVLGYNSTGDMRLAVERGELTGLCTGWESFKSLWRSQLESGEFVIVLQALPKPHPDLPKVPLAVSLLSYFVAFLVLVFGSRTPGQAGITIDVPLEMRPLYEQIARLPPSSLIAGWPDDAVDDIPYLTGRRILVGFEIHQALHKSYADEMRRRVQALIDAYFAENPAPLRRLKADFGVTHLLVDREHYGPRPPRYFKPFDEMIAKAAGAMHGQPETLRQVPSCGIMEVGPFVLLDLDRIAER